MPLEEPIVFESSSEERAAIERDYLLSLQRYEHDA